MERYMKQGLKFFIIILLFISVCLPLVLIWLVENLYVPREDIDLTNGFMDRNPVQTYHILTYSMVIGNILASAFIAFNLNKV